MPVVFFYILVYIVHVPGMYIDIMTYFDYYACAIINGAVSVPVRTENETVSMAMVTCSNRGPPIDRNTRTLAAWLVAIVVVASRRHGTATG